MTTYRTFEPADASALRDALRVVPIPLGGVNTPRVQWALVAAVLRGRDLFVVAAFEDEAILGYAVVATRWRAFKRWIFVRHPLVLIDLIAGRLRRRRKARAAPTAAEATSTTASSPHSMERFPSARERGVSWRDQGPGIAKVVYVGVRPDARGRGIGRDLIAEYVKECGRRGFHRVDSRIGLKNHASIRMSRSTGAELLQEGSAVLVVRHPK